MQSEVMQHIAEKRRQAESRLAQLKAEQEAAIAEIEAMQQSEQSTSEALIVFERLLEETPNELKPGLFKILFKTLEQEAKLNGINLQAEVTVSANGSANTNGKRTRKSTDEIETPALFSVFPNNPRLAVDGTLDGNTVGYSKVYIGIEGVRTTPVTQSSSAAWKSWIVENGITNAHLVKVGTPIPPLEGNYMLELSDVSIKELSKLVDLDFSQGPNSDDNEERMNRDYTQLSLPLAQEDEEPAEEPEQTEEIMESEPVIVQPQPTTATPTEDLCAVGTKFQVAGISGFDGNYGEIVNVIPGTDKPYECKVDGFPHNLMLHRDQFDVIPNAEPTTQDENLAEIPF